MRPRGYTFVADLAAFIVLEVAAFCLLVNSSTTRQIWLATGFNDVKAVLWRPVDNLRRYSNLEEENERLSSDNLLLTQRLLEEKNSLRSEMAKWTKSLGSEYEVIPANIVTMTNGSQHNYIIVDRGKSDNVEVNDGIITAKGVIGVITNVGEHYCYAMSYANQQMTISAKAGTDNFIGSLNWSGKRSDESVLSGIPLHANIEDSDIVYTSGYSSIFPPDIPIGVVVDRKNDESTSSFTIRLFEDFAKIQHVMIVKNLGRNEINELENAE